MKKQYSSIDIMKFVCALLVAVLHVTTYGLANMAENGSAPTGSGNWAILYILPACYLILRIAVPFFFIASSFFLFKKIHQNPENRIEILKNFYKRIFLLWLFWFIVSLPYMIDKIFIVSPLPLVDKFACFILKLILQGGFDGAWYLWTTIISVFIVDKLRNVKIRWNLCICILFYLLACLFSSYYNIVNISPNALGNFLNSITNYLNSLDISLYHSFLSGTIFIFVGKLFAERGNFIHLPLPMLIAYPILGYGELFMCTYFSLNVATDFFIMLLPFSIAFFQTILNWEIKPRPIHKQLRTFSTFIYLYHFAFLYIVYRMCELLGFSIVGSVVWTVVMFVLIIITGIPLCLLNQKLSNKKYFKFLKYSY